MRPRVASGHVEHKIFGALAILDYSRLTQFDQTWDEATLLRQA